MNQTGALRKLLAAFDAHEAMLIAYRTGGHTPGKAIDTITRVKTVLPQIRELIDLLPDSDPHTETLAAYREYYEASQAVEQGVVDFDLHDAAVTRLTKATDRVRVVRDKDQP